MSQHNDYLPELLLWKCDHCNAVMGCRYRCAITVAARRRRAVSRSASLYNTNIQYKLWYVPVHEYIIIYNIYNYSVHTITTTMQYMNAQDIYMVYVYIHSGSLRCINYKYSTYYVVSKLYTILIVYIYTIRTVLIVYNNHSVQNNNNT